MYELLKPVEKRDNWIFILDHTIEFGNQKCLLILGITLERFMENRCLIKHEDMDVLQIEITSKTNSDRILKTLKKLVKQTGVPKQIISDYGGDIKRAVRLFCDKYNKTTYSYDVTHKCALLLKHMLQNDERWGSFIKACLKQNERF
ncbi:MAG: hypothetical protein HQK83_18455 [Fibrobacteria bacterium]|nr:hypothetical protein [Fibrobacteria bacterium]